MGNNTASDNNNSNIVKTEVKSFVDTASFFDPNIIQTAANHANSALEMLGIVDEAQRLIPVIFEPYNTKEDFDWFTSGQVSTRGFEGKYIAIWRKQIVGSGDSPIEVERITKAYYGDDSRPAIIFVPKDEDAIL